MNLTVEQLIARAIKALETGQPGLAVLYMRKARVILAADKSVSVLESVFGQIAAVFTSMGEAFSAFAQSIVDALFGPTARSDFTLDDRA